MMETISQLILTFLLNAAWQITLITIIAFCCHRLLQNASARLQHLVWVIALILSFGLPLYTGLSLSGNKLFEPQTTQIINFQASSNTGPEQMVFEKSEQEETNSIIPVNRNLSIGLLSIYLLFLVYQGVKLCRAWRRTQTIRNKAFLVENSEDILTITEKCERVFGMKKVRVLFSSGINSPITVGAFNPIIMLPEQLSHETDENILLSAIGHESVHVRRHDYLLNLLYEFIYLPLSFHPAAALVKRRIKETRELSCDELVTDRLLKPDVYADSLVFLAGSAMDLGRNTNITIGINDADILENRIMRILKRPKINVFQKTLLLISAALMFAAVFAATTAFTLRPVIAQQTNSQEDKKKAELDVQQQKEQKEVLDKKAFDNVYFFKKEDNNFTFITKQDQGADQLKQKVELEKLIQNQAELAKQAKISMADALQIAAKQQPGMVLEARLVFVNINDSTEIFYAIKIASDQDKGKGEAKIVSDQDKGKGEKLLMVNAVTGKVTAAQ